MLKLFELVKALSNIKERHEFIIAISRCSFNPRAKQPFWSAWHFSVFHQTNPLYKPTVLAGSQSRLQWRINDASIRFTKRCKSAVSQQRYQWTIGLFELYECGRVTVSRHQSEFVGFGIRIISFTIPPIRPARWKWANYVQTGTIVFRKIP